MASTNDALKKRVETVLDMALSTVSSLSESFVSSAPLTGEETALVTEKEKEGSTAIDQKEAVSVNGASIPGTSTTDIHASAHDERPGTSNSPSMLDVPSNLEASSIQSDVAEQQEESKAHNLEDVPDTIYQNESSALDSTSTVEQPTTLRQTNEEAQITTQGGNETTENGFESDASSDDEAVLQIHG